MNKLFTQRRARHFMLLLRYWRLVFNDHFVIALFFMFGALAYGYSQWLPQVRPQDWWIRWILVAWFTMLAQFGRLATLIKDPDPVFLLPQVKSINRYFRQALTYSLVLAEIITIVGTFVALPLALTIEKLNIAEIIVIFLIAMINKADWLWVARKAISQRWGYQIHRTQLEFWINPFCAAVATWLINPFIGLVVALVLWLAVRWYYRDVTLDWRLAVKHERDRMYSVYRFFNLFTDVPSVQGNVKRRRWAAGLIKWLSKEQHPWAYLYAHAFVRGTDVSGITSRLTLLGMIIVFVLPSGWLLTVIDLLFVYLVATQLIPLYDQYENKALTHLYPVTINQQRQDFQQLLTKVTFLEAILISIASIGWQLRWEQMVLNLVLALGEVLIITRFYFKVRVKKLIK